jgi:hypothetical protein
MRTKNTGESERCMLVVPIYAATKHSPDLYVILISK